MKTILDTILDDVRGEVAAAKLLRSPADLRGMAADAAPPRDFHAALASSFGLIAEIKERSPSVGPMREENVREAASAYAESPVVRAVSVLTNQRHFGMDIARLLAVRAAVPQPVLRKDFLLDEYQVREARAFGADAVLLMANVLDAARLRGFYDLARELGMEVLFEVHTAGEIGSLPEDARIAGINSRKFQSQSGFVGPSETSEKDFSLDTAVFSLAEKLPSGCLRVAESGISPATLGRVREDFQAALVGTSLLRDPRGLPACLREFEEAATGNL
ncbi:MAG: indole-3-glycerol phosphate synthase TrpC [Verrucomicrobiae bacterium]